MGGAPSTASSFLGRRPRPRPAPPAPPAPPEASPSAIVASIEASLHEIVKSSTFGENCICFSGEMTFPHLPFLVCPNEIDRSALSTTTGTANAQTQRIPLRTYVKHPQLGAETQRAMPATLKDLGMKARRGGGAFASPDKSAAKKKGSSKKVETAASEAAAVRPPSKAPPKSPKTTPKTAKGGGDAPSVWDRRRTMLLLEAVRAESSGEPTLDPAAQEDDEYIENVTSRVNGVSEDDVRALSHLSHLSHLSQESPCSLLLLCRASQ